MGLGRRALLRRRRAERRERFPHLLGESRRVEAQCPPKVRYRAVIDEAVRRDPDEPDRELAESGLDFTIVRPGGLTDDPGTDLVAAAADLGRYGQIPRDDVAATLVACLDEPNTIGKSFDLLSGETPIPEALAAL